MSSTSLVSVTPRRDRNFTSLHPPTKARSWTGISQGETAKPATYQRTQEEERHAQRIDESVTTLAAPREPADWSDMGDERVLRSQLRRRVFGAILALPAIYRAPVMLRDIQAG